MHAQSPGKRPPLAAGAVFFHTAKWIYLASVMIAMLLISCAPRGSRRPASPVPAMIGAREIGKVVLVNIESRFVLLETRGGYPEPGTLLTIRRVGSPATSDAPAPATARVGTERRGGFVVADIVSGEPIVQDAAFY